jgi:hypothetical protein
MFFSPPSGGFSLSTLVHCGLLRGKGYILTAQTVHAEVKVITGCEVNGYINPYAYWTKLSCPSGYVVTSCMHRRDVAVFSHA